MISAYRVFVSTEVIAKLRTVGPRERQAVIHLLEQLSEDPFRSGDYVETDEIGRPIQVLIVASNAIYYWPDHAVREIKVLDLKPLGN